MYWVETKGKSNQFKIKFNPQISNNFQFHRIKYNFALTVSVCVRRCAALSVWYISVPTTVCLSILLLSVVRRATSIFSTLCYIRQRFRSNLLLSSIHFFQFQLNFMKYKPRWADAAKKICERKIERKRCSVTFTHSINPNTRFGLGR